MPWRELVFGYTQWKRVLYNARVAGLGRDRPSELCTAPPCPVPMITTQVPGGQGCPHAS